MQAAKLMPFYNKQVYMYDQGGIKRNLHSCIENKPIDKNQSTRNTVLSTLIHPTNVAIFDQDVVVILTKTKSLLLRRRP